MKFGDRRQPLALDTLSQCLSKPSGRWSLLLLAIVILTVAWPWVDAVRYDRRIESLLSSNDPAVRAFVAMRQELGGADSVVVVWREPNLLEPDGRGLAHLSKIISSLNDCDQIAGTLSLMELNSALGAMGVRAEYPILSPDEKLSFIFRELFSGYTHSADGEWASVVVLFNRDVEHRPTIDRIDEIIRSELGSTHPFYIVGEPAIIVEGMALLEADGMRLSRTILVLLSVTLLVLLRRPYWIVVVVLVVLWSRWMTRAVLAASGIRLTMISGMLDSVLTVIAVGTVMHLALRFSEEATRYEPADAARRTWRGLLAPMFWSLTTTAIGFGSLASSSIVPVKQFGGMMACGTFFVFLSVLLICPVFMGPPFVRHGHRASRSPWLRRRLLQVLSVVSDHPYTTVFIAMVLASASILGVMQLQVETNFLHNFRDDSSIVRSYEVVEEHLGGAGVWDIVLPAPERLTNTYIQFVFELEKELRNVETDSGAKLTKVLSLADADIAAKSQSRLLAFAGPTIRLKGMQLAIPAFFEALVHVGPSPQSCVLRILLRSNEQATATEKLQLIERVEQTVNRHVQADAWQKLLEPNANSNSGSVTGYYVLLTRLVAGLLADQWASFFIASTGIVLCVWIATGRLSLAIAATLPSVLPILMVLGTVGFLGIRVNLGAAMIAAVSVGLSIDGSIHYLHNYRSGLLRGKSRLAALRQSQRSTGLAVSIATIALAIGLLTLTGSPLKPTAAFGLLSGITLLAGLVGNLVLLPALVICAGQIQGDRKRLTKNFDLCD